MTVGRGIVLLIAAWMAVGAGAGVAVATPPEVVVPIERVDVDSSGGSLWICAHRARTPGPVVPSPHDGERCDIYLVRAGQAGQGPRLVRSIAAWPSLVAAGGDDLWLAIRDGPSEGTTIYRLAGGNARQANGLAAAHFGDLEPVVTIPGDVRALVAGGEGPLVETEPGGQLLRVEPLATHAILVSGELPGPDEGGGGALGDAVLSDWPESGSGQGGGSFGWALFEDDGTALRIGEPVSVASDAATLRWRTIHDGAGWRSVPGARMPAVWREAGGVRAVRYVRESTLAAVGSFPSDAASAEIAFLDGEGGGFFAVAPGATGSGLRAWRMDPVSGAVEPLAWEEGPAPVEPATWWPLPVVGALTVAAVVALIIMRPGRGGVQRSMLPAGWEPLPLPLRAFAFLVDAFPVWIALVLLRQDVEMSHWTAWPAWSGNPESLQWGMLFIALVTLASGIEEGLTGTSLGKRLVGAGVVRIGDGGASPLPTRRRLILRALLRAAILVAPALAFLTLIDPSLCGLPEVVTRTAVARRSRAAARPGARDA